MDKKLSLLLLPLLGQNLSLHAADIDYTPLRLSGFNADVVLQPGERVVNTADGHWNFYSEELKGRGGLPQMLHGMFSDVPYQLADFSAPCAFKLSSPDIDAAEGTAYGQSITIALATPQKAHTLWLLATAPHGATKVNVTVHFADGSTQVINNIAIANWKATQSKGSAFWQLGLTNGDSSAADTNYALYEAPISLSDATHEVTSITVSLAEKGRSVCLFAVTATDKTSTAIKDKKLFFISNSHLDTQWNWTVKSTIADYVKNTLNQTFERLEDKDDHHFTFNFEGAIKYMWAKEYYPTQYKKLKKYIADGRWNIAGAAIDASDVNIGSAESLIRNFLYGQSFYRKEFGVRGGRDIMLPDCFGFPWSLPTVAAHCGMKYFHTQKLSWNSAYAYNQLPRFARWKGTDGEEVLSVLKLCAYDEHEKFRKDMSADADMIAEVNTNKTEYGIPATIKYVGPRGDRGGGLDKETADWLSKSVDGSGQLGVTLNSSTGMLDQLFHMGYDKLPVINHGLPMRAHGVGGYTSRTMLKYWMRKGELLGDAAEKASLTAHWLGTLPYQQKTLTDAWVRLLWHQFHDDIPGTCINDAYTYTVNDQVLNQLDFSRTLNNAVGGVAKLMNTQWCQDVPVVVYNPLSIQRTDIVEGQIAMAPDVQNIKVTDAQGNVVPCQITEREDDGRLHFIFLATVPSLGYATYNVAPDTNVSTPTSASNLSVSEKGMENQRYKVTIDANGDVSSIIDKQNGNREMLSAPIRLALLFDESNAWPSWEIHGDQLQKAPREYVDKEGLQVEVAENGPLRVSLKVTRKKGASDFVQYIRLASEGCADRIDFVNEVNWQTRERLLKATFPLTVSNPKATYDLSIGTDVNNNSTSYSTDSNNNTSLCEFLGHQWADVTNTNGDCGVSILNDSKYGWDKQKDNEIRLTLIHTPKVGSNNYAYQGKQDLGLNRFTYSFFAHKGVWGADTQWEADKLNEPMLAYQTTCQEGSLGSDFGFLKVDNRNVAVKALKKAEGSDKYIVRFYELTGKGQDVTVEFPADIVSADEVNGVEELLGPAQFSGRKLSFHIDRFHPKTFQFELASSTASSASTVSELAPQSVPVSLDYNVDVMSTNERRSDADIDKAFPAELLGSELKADGISFTMGNSRIGKKNAVRCMGQTITLPTLQGARKVYILASSLNTKGSTATFGIGTRTVEQFVDYYGGMVGVWSNSIDVQKHYRLENTAFTATHSHSKTADNVYDYLYMYKYAFTLNEGDNTITLPNDPDLLVYAISVSDNANDDTKPLSEVVNVLKHKDTKDPYQAVEHDDDIITPATVQASGQTNSNESAQKACDGNADTKWCDNSSAVKWLEYKFEKPMTITGWKVLNAGCEGDGKIAAEYVLQRYVNDGWVDVQTVADNSVNTTDFVLEHPFVSEGVRLRVVKGEQDGTIARVYEFSVYGHEPKEGEADQPQIISRIPTYGFGQQVATVVKSSGRVNEKEDPYFMLDSQRGTKWCYNGSLEKPSVVFELSEPYMLTGFDIYDSKTHEVFRNSDEYEIAYSMDGNTYTTAVSEKGVSAEDVHSSTLTEPVKAKYVKLTMAKGDGAVRVYQFDMWGTPTAETEPTATTGLLSLHRSVIGSNSPVHFNESALNLFDGLKTRTLKPFTWKVKKTNSADVYAWAVVDLGATCNMNQFKLYDSKNFGGTHNISGYRIYVSNTRPTDTQMKNYARSAGGVGWKRVANVTDASSENTKTYVPDVTVSGRYVKLEIPYSCVTDSALIGQFEVYGQVASGIDNVSAESNIVVYPKVVEQGTDIHLGAAGHNASYSIVAVGGETVAVGHFSGNTKVSSTMLKKGVYMVTIVADRKRKTEKVIVK